MRVRGPRKPSARRVSAALSPASEAPTITMRPLSLKAALVSLLLMRLLCFRAVCCLPLDDDSLNGTGRCRAQYVLTLRFVRGWIVPERFLPMQLEDAGGEKTTLGIGLAPIEINHHMDGTRRCSRFCQMCVYSCHLFVLPSCSRAFPLVGTRPRRACPRNAVVLVRVRLECLAAAGGYASGLSPAEGISSLKGPPGKIAGCYSGDAPRPLWHYDKEEAS